jgi:hypothetical protein
MDRLPSAHNLYKQVFGYDPWESERVTLLYIYNIKYLCNQSRQLAWIHLEISWNKRVYCMKKKTLALRTVIKDLLQRTIEQNTSYNLHNYLTCNWIWVFCLVTRPSTNPSGLPNLFLTETGYGVVWWKMTGTVRRWSCACWKWQTAVSEGSRGDLTSIHYSCFFFIYVWVIIH